MVEGGGSLRLRGTEEATQIGRPTTIVGTIDDSTGAIAASFSTPVLSFELPVEEFDTSAYIDATFTETAAGTTTGAVTLVEGDATRANVSVSTTLRVALHIEVGRPAFVTADCVATPIVLQMASEAPYDSDVGAVTLVDDDFRVPPVVEDAACPEFIATRVNEMLAGSGHSISLTAEGSIPLPAPGTEDTATALAVEPGPASRQGDAVTLTATVVPGPGAALGVPTGQVEMRAGSAVIGAALLDASGRAVLVTEGLVVGEHQLTARYVGDEVYRPSVSSPTPHLVAADPIVAVAMADTVLYGGTPRTIQVDVANPTRFGQDIVNGRLDITLRRNESTSFLNVDAIRLEWLHGDTWERIPLAYDSGARVATGSVGPIGGEVMTVGAQVRRTLRLAMPDPIDSPAPTTCNVTSPPCIGDWELTVGLVEVTPGEGTVVDDLIEVVHPFVLVEAIRRTTTLGISGGAPRPHTARQGTTIDLAVSVGPSIGGAGPGGFFELYVDGRPTPARSPVMPYEDGYVRQVPMGTGLALLQFPVGDLDLGRHQVTARYLGDALFAPAEITTSFTVLPATGSPFVCRTPTQSGNNWYGVGMTFEAEVPAVATAGSTFGLDVGAVGWAMSRSGVLNPFPSLLNNSTVTVGEGSLLDGVRFTLGPDGTGSAQSANRTLGTALAASPNPADESQVDQRITFGGPEASVTVDGAPGDIVPITLDEVQMAMHLSGAIPIPMVTTCTPVGEPMELGEVLIAGTAVSVSPERAREGTDVVQVEARTFPSDAAGTVSFSSDLDGVLGTDAVDGGVASWTVEGLSPGRHVISAAFDASDPGVPDSVGTATVTVSYSPRSASERFVVAARTDYLGSADRPDVVADAAALDGGKSRTAYLNDLSRSDGYLAHVVDGMYRDTLGRTGDEEGAAFWVGRLRAGWTVARVAANFYGSDEYVARVGGTDEAWVRDLYDVLLGRDADDPGLAYWVGEVPRRGRGGVALAFFQTPESARVRVVALYDRFLGRRPSAADRDFWAARVIARGDLVLAVELTLSREYGRRAENRFPLV